MAQREFRYALVVGASSGIGEALARRLAAAGARVALVGRREPELRRVMDEINAADGDDRAVAITHDVRATGEIPELVQEIARVLGGLDLMIYAAGVMAAVAEDEYDTAKDQEMIDINLVGAVAWLNPVAEAESDRWPATAGVPGTPSTAPRRPRSTPFSRRCATGSPALA